MRTRETLLLLLVLPGLGACAAAPLPITDEGFVLGAIAGRSREFFGDGLPLLRPRFGLPAVLAGENDNTVDIQLLVSSTDPSFLDGAAAIHAVLAPPGTSEDQLAACAHGDLTTACAMLTLDPPRRERVGAPDAGGPTLVHLAAHLPPSLPTELRGLDLYLAQGSRHVRAARAIWRRPSPSGPGAETIRVAQLSDIHVGKGDPAELDEHLRRVIADVNRDRPDVVLITGDITNRGGDPALARHAAALLATVDAPCLTIVGNHDLGFGHDALAGAIYEAGWSNFARSFHALLHYSLDVGGVRFIGFDSGPSTPSPQVFTRGLAAATVATLRREIEGARAAGLRAVVLFSHAPTRAALSPTDDARSRGGVGRMRDGGDLLERAMLDAASAGTQVIHMAGHTHWSDLFFARSDGGDGRSDGSDGKPLGFTRLDEARVGPCPVALDTPAALVTTQSATHPGAFRRTGHGYGYALLVLDPAHPWLAFHRYDVPTPETCR